MFGSPPMCTLCQDQLLNHGKPALFEILILFHLTRNMVFADQIIIQLSNAQNATVYTPKTPFEKIITMPVANLLLIHRTSDSISVEDFSHPRPTSQSLVRSC